MLLVFYRNPVTYSYTNSNQYCLSMLNSGELVTWCKRNMRSLVLRTLISSSSSEVPRRPGIQRKDSANDPLFIMLYKDLSSCERNEVRLHLPSFTLCTLSTYHAPRNCNTCEACSSFYLPGNPLHACMAKVKEESAPQVLQSRGA